MLKNRNILVAITGGSGSGKTFLAERLCAIFHAEAIRLSLDDFYLDRSKLSPARRAQVNFDHPRAIDWPLAEKVLRDCRSGLSTQVPKYDFRNHLRSSRHELWIPTPLVLWDGLWLLWRPALRELFDLSVFLDCPRQLRLERRLTRDTTERGRAPDSVREQFWRSVTPMHERYVAPQAAWADVMLQQPASEVELADLVGIIRNLLAERSLPSPRPSSPVTASALKRREPSGRRPLSHAHSTAAAGPPAAPLLESI